MSSTSTVTRAQFEYSIVKTFADYTESIANALLLTEVKEQTLRKFKVANICHKSIRNYFTDYDGETPPASNGLNKSEIETMVELFNALMDTNFWFEFPED